MIKTKFVIIINLYNKYNNDFNKIYLKNLNLVKNY